MGRSTLVCLAFVQLVLAAEVAKVKDAPASVYSKSNKASAVVGTLEAGKSVTVDLSVGMSDGMWCSVTEVGGKALSGYLPCAQLVRPAAEKRQVVSPLSEASTSDAPRAESSKTGGVNEAKVNELKLYNYHPFYWADRLAYSPEQKTRMDNMLSEGGVARCIEETRQIVIRNGIRDLTTLMSKVSEPKFSKEFEGPFQACADKLFAYWEKAPSMLRADQKARLDADRALLPPGTGFAESQFLLMFPQPAQKR